ncbi:MAG: hypothetical protein F6J95_015910 [Leptolyngbya sp. SIO1E4]|nr:hypothetical protein [Leptolyngbya sp. SIO1E4]
MKERALQRERIVQAVNRVLTIRRNGRSLPDRWLEVLRGCLDGKTYSQIDDLVQFGQGGAKDAANQNLWPQLSEVLGVQVGKRNCLSVLQSHLPRLEAIAARSATEAEPEPLSQPEPEPEPEPELETPRSGIPTPELAWATQQTATTLTANNEGLPPTPALIHSQAVALDNISYQIRHHCRLIVLTGLPKTGKTLLVEHLRQAMRGDFEQTLLYSAEEVRTLDSLARRVLNDIQGQDHNGRYQGLSAQERLQEVFRRHMLLIAITNADRLYRRGVFAGHFNDAAVGYESFLRMLATSHPGAGCLIWSSLSPPSCLHALTQSSQWVYRYKFPTLEDVDFAALAEDYGQSATAPGWVKLVKFCGGHHEWIQRSLQSIEREHRGAIESFLASPQLWDPELYSSLQDVSPEEKDILTWVVLRKLTLAFLQRLVPGYTLRNQAISSLEKRGLLRWQDDRYQLTAQALRYILAAFIVDELKQEIEREEFDRLHRYPLFLVEAPTYQQHWHRCYLLKPLAAHLQRRYPDSDSQKSWLMRTLAIVRMMPAWHENYAASNVLNIAGCWGLNFAECDLSGLSFDQLNLRTVNPQGLNFQNCHFGGGIAWPILLSRPLRAKMSASGKTIAVSDRTGQLLVWRQADDVLKWQLMDCIACGQEIQDLAVSENMIVFAVAQRVYCWWPDPDSQINALHELDSYDFSGVVNALAITSADPPNKVAVATSQGEIAVLNLVTEQQLLIQAYSDQLSLSPDGTTLASFGFDNSIRCWTLLEDELQPLPTECLEQSFDGVFIGFGWQGSRIYAAESLDAQVGLCYPRKERWPLHQASWVKAIFSGDGRWIVGQQQSGDIAIWRRNQDHPPEQHGVITSDATPIQVTHQGERLLLESEGKVQFWDILSRRCIWEIAATSPEWSVAGINWQGATGLPDVEQKLWRLQGDPLPSPAG